MNDLLLINSELLELIGGKENISLYNEESVVKLLKENSIDFEYIDFNIKYFTDMVNSKGSEEALLWVKENIFKNVVSETKK